MRRLNLVSLPQHRVAPPKTNSSPSNTSKGSSPGSSTPQGQNNLENAVKGTILGFTGHGVDRMISRGINPNSILDAVKNPLTVGPILVDELGRPSQSFTGKAATIIMNPETHRVITCWNTSALKALKLLLDINEK